MTLKESQKEFIDALYSNLPDNMASKEDIHEYIVDQCMDNEGLFDLSEDEEGDLYESYSNLIWEYLSEK
jgi:hypothetical protein